jgi:hypothetical protein
MTLRPFCNTMEMRIADLEQDTGMQWYVRES